MPDKNTSYQPPFIQIGSTYPRYPEPKGRNVYRLTRPLTCAKCKKTMQVNDLLTLHYPHLRTRKPGQPRGGLQPYCDTCYPIILDEQS